MIFIHKILFLVSVLPVVILGSESIEFDKTTLGTVFSPYNKFHGDKTDYEVSEIKTMLELVSKRFQKISTYGMGTTSATSKWNETNHAEGLVAFAAAELNKENQAHLITVNVGMWQAKISADIRKQDIENAFDAATEANKKFNGTVSGIILTTQWGDDQLGYIIQMLTDNQNRANRLSLKMGIRSTTCDDLSSKAKNSNSLVSQVLQKLDFIVCYKLPTGTNVTRAVDSIGTNLLTWKNNFKIANPSISIIGETGWLSEKMTNDGLVGSVENMKDFWLGINEWSKTNNFPVDMFTAFDEPWKESEKGREFEKHFGWWKRINNETNGPEAFIEKIYFQEKGKSYRTEIGLGLFGGFILLGLILSIAFLYIRLKDVQSQLLTKSDIEEFEKGKQNIDSDGLTEDALRLPYDRSYEISKHKFIIDRTKLLGSGAFGSVYRGKLDNNENDVAFKMTQPNCSSNNLKSLLSEIKIMIHVGKHPNVVSIIGAYTGEMRQGMIMIAIELCDVSLEKHLRTNKHSFLKFSSPDQTPHYVNDPTANGNSKPLIHLNDLIKWSYHIACGMEHIASKNVIHSDLAIRNVLLTSGGTAKITDFGLSRRLYEYTNYVKTNQEPLPWRWMSLEALKNFTFSTKSDVWSYAIALWEIFSLGDTPYPGLAWTVDFTQRLEEGLRLPPPQYAISKIYDKMLECWNDDPEKRPNFADMKEFFEIVLNETTTLDYKNLQSVYETNNVK